MRINPLPVYQKGKSGKAKPPTKAQIEEWDRIVALGCIAPMGLSRCGKTAQRHHCGTGAGGRKDHDYVIGLCQEHHTGRNGIDGQVLSKRGWQVIYGTEKDLWFLTHKLLKRVLV